MKYLVYRLAQLFARRVPRPLAYWIGLRVSDLYFFLNPRSRAGVIANLRQLFAHEGQVFSEHELRVLARETFHNFGKHLVPVLTTIRRSQHRKRTHRKLHIL